MTLADLKAVDMVERWRALPAEQQHRIGALMLTWIFAELVTEDDGSDTTEADRDEARAMSDQAFEAVANAVEAAFPDVCWGLDDAVTPHVLRHTCATWLVQSGVPLWEVAGYLGMTVEMVERVYGHHAPEHLREAARALA